MYDALPKNEKTINFKVLGKVTGILYEGAFIIKCILSTADSHSKELAKTRLMADSANPSTGLFGIAHVLASVRTKITKAPQWWGDNEEGYSLLDQHVLFDLLDEFDNAEQEWKDSVKALAEEAQLGNDLAES